MKTQLLKSLPLHIRSFLKLTNGWLVGKALENIYLSSIPKDYDIIIPDRDRYAETLAYMNVMYDLECNNFGGFSFIMKDTKVEIWCQELSDYLITSKRLGYVCNFDTLFEIK